MLSLCKEQIIIMALYLPVFVQPSVEFYKHLSDQPIATAAFGLHSFMPTKTSSECRRGEPSSEAPVEAR